MQSHSPRIERLCRTLAQLSASDGCFAQSPFVLVVKLALMVLFKLALLGKILEAALRHECTTALWVMAWAEGLVVREMRQLCR